MSTTKQEPALCTKAPVVGVSSCRRESTIAAKLIARDRLMLNRMVLAAALASRLGDMYTHSLYNIGTHGAHGNANLCGF